MHDELTPLDSFWRAVARVMAIGFVLASSPVAFFVRELLQDPVGHLLFFSVTGVGMAAVVIRFIVRSVNRYSDPRYLRLPDESQ